MRFLLACTCLALAWTTGCNRATDDAPPADAVAEAPAAADAQAPADLANSDGPEGAVYRFLEAVRTGNDQKTESMFSTLAREKLKELKDIQVAPPGSDTAKFTIGKVELLSDDGARVTCQWTDLDQQGDPRTDEITWMVRKEPEGWRIAGMAATIFEGEPQLLLNFEEPQETMQKLEMLRAEIRRRTEQADAKPEQQAKQPEKSDEAIRR